MCDSTGEIDNGRLEEVTEKLRREDIEFRIESIHNMQEFLLLESHTKMVKRQLSGCLSFYYEDGFIVDCKEEIS